MNNRIKKLRKQLDLTQEEFSSRINLSRNFIAQIETGTKTPSERTILDICREFDVDRNWLENGVGEPFISRPKDVLISKMFGDVLGSDESDFKRRFVLALSKLDDSGWENLEKLIDSISKKEE